MLENNGLLLLAVPVAIGIPLAIAALLHEHVRGWRFFRSVYFLPTAISWVVIGMFALRFFSATGVLNGLLAKVGFGASATDMLANEHSALAALAITFIWSMVGTNTIIFLTGMATLDPTLTEAARVDGLSRLQIFFRVTLPLLTRFIQFSFVITVISAFSALFSLIFVMTSGGTGLRHHHAGVLRLPGRLPAGPARNGRTLRRRPVRDHGDRRPGAAAPDQAR